MADLHPYVRAVTVPVKPFVPDLPPSHVGITALGEINEILTPAVTRRVERKQPQATTRTQDSSSCCFSSIIFLLRSWSHTMEQTRRRTVLADIGGQMAQGQGSSIPVPLSAMKKQVHRVPSNSRMSEMARASQSSSQGNSNGGMGGSIGHGPQATGSMGQPRQSRQSMMPGQQAVRGSTIGVGGEGRRSTIMAQNGGASAPRGDAGVYGRTPSGQRTMPSR